MVPDGRIVLTPAVTVSKNQLALNARPDILDAIDRSYAGDTVEGSRPARRGQPRRAKAPNRSAR